MFWVRNNVRRVINPDATASIGLKLYACMACGAYDSLLYRRPSPQRYGDLYNSHHRVGETYTELPTELVYNVQFSLNPFSSTYSYVFAHPLGDFNEFVKR